MSTTWKMDAKGLEKLKHDLLFVGSIAIANDIAGTGALIADSAT